jgi:hypothetical protein
LIKENPRVSNDNYFDRGNSEKLATVFALIKENPRVSNDNYFDQGNPEKSANIYYFIQGNSGKIFHFQ